MKFHKNTDTSNIFDQSTIVDYVAGHIVDEEVLTKFELRLEGDKALQNAVENEREFRDALLKSWQDHHTQDLIGDKALDKLFVKLDELDDGQFDPEVVNSVEQSRFSRSNWFTLTGVAASIFCAAILLVVGLQTNTSKPEFALLSDKNGTTQVDFEKLVNARKVVQILPVSKISPQELSKLFSKHKLTPISRAGQAWIVASSQPFSTQQLTDLNLLESFEKVSLISYQDQTKVVDK